MTTKISKKKTPKRRKTNLSSIHASQLPLFALYMIEGIERIPAKRLNEKQTIPEEGGTKFFVVFDKAMVYTSIGADNIHHAYNKSSKLFGPRWSRITANDSVVHEHAFLTYKAFKELLADVS